MPYLNDSLAKQKALAEGPTLGNLHPDARAQAIARAGLADAAAMDKRLSWLHSPAALNVDGYEWGIFRVKWENGKAVEVHQTRADFADVDAAMRTEAVALARKDALLRQSMEAQQALIEWDKARDFPVPYKVRDPIHAAIAAITKELEQPK